MQKNIPTVTLFLDQRIAKKTDKYPLKLTIYCKPEKKRYKTGIDLTEDEWKKVNSDKLRDKNLIEVRFKISALRTKASTILEDLIPFSFKKFEEAFYDNAIDLKSLNLTSLFDRYIAIQESKGSVGTAISYKCTINSLNAYKKNLSLNDVTSDILQDYEHYMLENGKSITTISIYLRQLRAIYNDSIARNLINKDDYPFGKNKYVIPASNNVKKALSTEEIKALLNHVPETVEERKALDFWKFSFYCNGMNFCDILKLKPENLTSDFISFIRTKTKNTKKGTQQPIRISLTNPKIMEILNKWKSDLSNPAYIFPVLTEEHTPRQVKYLIQDFIKTTNKHMEVIRGRLKISQKCNTYSCRHSFATYMKRENQSIEVISESLGHSSILTTSAYLASFEDKTKHEISNLLASL